MGEYSAERLIHKGVFVCVTREPKKCEKYNIEVEYEWCCDWPLDRRQQRCRSCRKPMLFVKLKKTMTEAAKARLMELTTRKKKEDEECRAPAAPPTVDTADRRSASASAKPRRKKLVRRKRG